MGPFETGVGAIVIKTKIDQRIEQLSVRRANYRAPRAKHRTQWIARACKGQGAEDAGIIIAMWPNLLSTCLLVGKVIWIPRSQLSRKISASQLPILNSKDIVGSSHEGCRGWDQPVHTRPLCHIDRDESPAAANIIASRSRYACPAVFRIGFISRLGQTQMHWE